MERIRDIEGNEQQTLERNAQSFIDFITKHNESHSSFAEHFDLGHYSTISLKKLIVKHPAMLTLYGDWMRTYQNVGGVAALFEGAPTYAEQLRPIFDGRPELLRAYTSFALDAFRNVSEPEQQKDAPLQTRNGKTRLSLCANLATIQNHINNVTQWQNALREKLGNAPYRQWSTIFGGVATLFVQKIEHHNPERGGIRIHLSPTDVKAYDFLPQEVTLCMTGVLDSRYHANDYQHFGYMPRTGKVDERQLIEALVARDFSSPQLIDAVEDAAGGIA
jgi:hypothetical protein